MIGMVLVTHGALAMNSNPRLNTSSVRRTIARPSPSVPMTIWKNVATTFWRRSTRPITGSGVVILTDMFGGTPSNLAISVMQNREVEVIAGVNLPMLVKLARVRSDIDIKEAVREAAGCRAANISTSPTTLGW